MTLNQRADDMLRHNADFNGVLYKYDLPVMNEPILFRKDSALQLSDESESFTATEALLNKLDVDKDTAYESFIIKLQ
jgi:hypothetical protein